MPNDTPAGATTKPSHAPADALPDAGAPPAAASVTEEELRELRALADAQAKFMSYLSHDLRGSLNGLVLMLEVIRREVNAIPGLDDVRADLDLMRNSVLETAALMERHLLADRLRRGRVEVRPQDVELRPALAAAIDRAAATPAAAERGITFRDESPAPATSPPAVVHTDPELLATALHELLDNAARYATPGSAVRVVADVRPDGGWSVEVADAGPGFSPSRLEQFLDPIKRMELRERGLGLTIARAAARLLRGRLEAHTAEAHRSTFRLVFPPPPY